MAENIDAERAAFNEWFDETMYRETARDAMEAAWLAARRTPSASTGEDGLPELPKQPEELRARWKCEDCDGTGEIGELIDQGYFQPPERARCTSCDGAGQVECEALLPEQVKEYAREAIAADRERQKARIMHLTHERDQARADLRAQLAQSELKVKAFQRIYDAAPEEHAQLARQSKGEQICTLRVEKGYYQIFGERDKIIGVLPIGEYPLYVAPPLSSEQQAEKGEGACGS